MGRKNLVIFPIVAAAAIGGFLLVNKLADTTTQATGTSHSRVVDIPLTDGDGRPFTLAAWPQQWTVLFFGYASCPDVCPMSLAYLSKELRSLGDLAHRVQPVFISVDPQRDRPEVLKQYVAAFDKHIIGATSTADNLSEMAKKLGVFYEVQPDSAKPGTTPGEAPNYTIVHSGAFFILKPDGTVAKTLSPPQAPGALSDALREIFSTGV